MNQSKNNVDYSQFGGSRVEDVSAENSQPKVDYSQFGGSKVEAPKEKAGKFKSALLGIYEGVLGIPGLVQYGVNEFSKGLESEDAGLSFQEENPILSHLSRLPESEGQAARRIRVAGNVLPLSIAGGIPGIVSGIVGSQAGQTIREVYGKDGKFEHFGWGEGAALTADVLIGGATGVGLSVARKAGQAATREVPAIFTNPQTGLQRNVTKVAIQQEENALNNVIKDFSQNQIRGFEQEATALSPNRFTELTQSNASALKRDADNMFRNTQLSIISPLETTPEQAGRAIQDSANLIFREEVQGAERVAYSSAREAAQGLQGEAPRTIEQAKALRDELTKVTPSPEQRPVIAFLDGLISDLETSSPATTTPASKLLDINGNPLVQAIEHEASTQPTTKSANDLIDLVQRGNQAVNYGSELRLQSHRLSPILDTLRQETGSILSKNPEAAQLYRDANMLHARNAETWGTKYMRNVRFTENPEQIIGATKKASNMRNFKQAIENPAIQGIAERAVVGEITEAGASSSRRAVRKISPELSPNARQAASNLINEKDPLTTVGGRTAIRNEILKDAAQAVNTGKRPEKILDLMQTRKGYDLVRESMRGSPQSRELFRSFQRLFMEDIVSSITDASGVIDFKKASQIFKNSETRQVVQQIGGDSLVRRFQQLENFANNFERNINLYSKPETQSLFKNIAGKTIGVGVLAQLLHSLHMPWPVIAGLGGTLAAGKGAKLTYDALQKKILSNPRAVHYLELVSQAKTTQELAKQLPRLITEIEKSD